MKHMKRLALIGVTVVVAAALMLSALAASRESGFSDVPDGAWYADAVEYVREHGLMSGTSGTTFSPNENTSRAMAVTILYRLAGQPEVTNGADFSDVSEDAYYAQAVSWAANNNVMSGYPDGRFGVDDPITRQQLAAVLWRYAGSPTADRGTDFADESSIASYASAAVDWARANGIVNGKEGNRFDPNGNATRAEMAVILRNFMDLEPDVIPDEDEEGAPKVLVTYFSRVGNTEFPSDVDAVSSASLVVDGGVLKGNVQLAAETIHSQMGGDLVEIVAEEKYPADYDETVDRNHEEQENGARPALVTQVNVSDYDIIFVGYPIWAMTLPAPVQTFLDTYDFEGKTVVPFCTHAGYGAGRTQQLIQELCDGAEVRDVLAIEDEDLSRVETLTAAWLSSLGLTEENAASAQAITITVGDTVVSAQLNDSPAARQFAGMLPVTLSMTRMGDHEYYDALPDPITEEGNTLQTGYTVGDLAFWTPGDLFALYFDEPERDPEGLIILGNITSDLSVFDLLGNPEEVTIQLVK